MIHSQKRIRKVLKRKPSWRYKLVYLILYLLAISAFISFIYVDFNLGNFKLAWISVLVGLLFGILISYLIKKLIPALNYREKSIKPNFEVLICTILMCLSPVIIQNANKHLLNGEEKCKIYKVLDKSNRAGGRQHFSFNVIVDNKIRIIDCEKDIWDKIELNSNIEMCIVTGCFGFDYIKSINPLTN